MQAPKRQGTQPRMFQMIDMEALIPENHILRQLDRVVNWSIIYERTQALYAERGRPATDPILQFRLMILSYLFNHSERALYQMLPMHAGYLWFCGLDFEDILQPDQAELRLPDRTTLVKTRKLWREHGVFDDLMRDIVQQCMAAGLVQSVVDVAVDGTQVKANASIHSLAEIHLAPVESVESYLARQAKEDAGSPAEADSDDPPPPAPPGNAKDVQEAAVLEDFHGKTFSNRTHRSTTDPDARLYKKSKGQEAHLRFLVHNLLDVRSGVILDTTASIAAGTAERQVSMQQIRRLRFQHPALHIRTLLGDKGYEAAWYLHALLDQHILPLVSLRKTDPLPLPTYKTRALQPSRIARRKREQELITACNTARAIQREGRYRAIQAKRARIEHAFAEAKQVHGMTGARSRGLCSMDEQAKLTAIVQNMKRLCRYVTRRPKPTPGSEALLATVYHLFFLLYVGIQTALNRKPLFS